MARRCFAVAGLAAFLASTVTLTAAAQEPVAQRHQKLKRLVREAIESATTEGETPDRKAKSLRDRIDWNIYNSSGICFGKPQFLESEKCGELWYSLGFVDFGDVQLDFSQPLVPPDDPSQPEGTSPNGADPYLYPLKAQYLAELVRHFDEDRGLQKRIEGVVIEELRAIERHRATAGAAGKFDPESLAGDNFLAKLADYDERVVRIVMRFLSDTARQRNCMLRRIRLAGGPLPPAVTATLTFQSDQPPDEIWRICDGYFDYLVALKGDSYKKDREYVEDHPNPWARGSAEAKRGKLEIIPGDWHVLALWKDDNDKVLKFAYKSDAIERDGHEIELAPHDYPVPPGE
jgi:hypothetical protein